MPSDRDPTPQDIAAFRYGIKKDLVAVTGYLYFCSDIMNELLKQTEGLPQDAPATYCILMCNKVVPRVPNTTTSNQRNIYFRYDLHTNVFYMDRT